MAFQDKTVAIIGGGSGIGLRVAHGVIAGGGSVVLGGRSEARLADAVAELGSSARAKIVDLEDRPSIAAFFGAVG